MILLQILSTKLTVCFPSPPRNEHHYHYGYHYHQVDLAALFRVWNQQRNSYTIFSQDHAAKCWLGLSDNRVHDAVTDASISMSLFNAYRHCQWDDNALRQMQVQMSKYPNVQMITNGRYIVFAHGIPLVSTPSSDANLPSDPSLHPSFPPSIPPSLLPSFTICVHCVMSCCYL